VVGKQAVDRGPRVRRRPFGIGLGLPVKVVVFNNSALGFIEIEQKSTGFLDYGTGFKNPNFAAMAEASGVRGIRLEDPADVDKGIADALAHDGPVLVDAVVSNANGGEPRSSVWARQGRHDEARRVLRPIYDRFTEGFDTPDLRAAKRLLDELE
jgi:TPP-dependent trihydroxycyclohexane-1,2-dione (THcHDO) dehydratase